MILLDGRKTSAEIKEEIAESVKEIKQQGNRPPHLAAVLVGDNGASMTYVGAKVKACEFVGFESTLIKLPEQTTEQDLLKQIDLLNNNPEIDGYIVQLPLPKHINEQKILMAWEFVRNFPDGINTNIGDSGNNLSGGQKQRLSIARAVLKNSPIMILDEATSALDTESEREVQDALENMMRNRTSIVIAHRLSTIQNADNIIVMKKGEIVEQGKHIDLLEKKGVYHKLVLLQSLD